MKIAVGIACHKNAEQVNNLIAKFLESPNFDVFVHVDKKSNIIDSLMHNERIIYTTEQHDVRWGEIGVLDSCLALMREVKKSNKAYDYFWILSGQDYLIKPLETIVEFFEKNNGNQHMTMFSEDEEWYPDFYKRVSIWYPAHFGGMKFYQRVIRRAYKIITGGKRHSFIKRKNKLNLKFAFGPNWFAITTQLMLKMLDKVDQMPQYHKFFINVVNSDEAFFQTMASTYFPEEKYTEMLCYTNFAKGASHPNILQDEDYITLKNSTKLIARKFDYPIPKQLATLSIVDSTKKESEQ